ncbi:GIY-YIG nuclease family protein [Azospirillum doebereinerae]
MISLRHLLTEHGLDLSGRVKMLRHAGSPTVPEEALRDLHRRGLLSIYQAAQSQKRLDCDLVLAFLGEGATEAVFAGAWRILGSAQPIDSAPLPPEFPADLIADCRYWYRTEPVPALEALIDRVVIDWGKPRPWDRVLGPDDDRAVLEIRRTGFVTNFHDYDDVSLTFPELTGVIRHPAAHPSWHTALSATAAVYLIVDSTDGHLYVGSACGQDGLLGRWRCYVETMGHGNNLLLRQRAAQDPGWSERLRFSILKTLPASITTKEAVAAETRWKIKLGSKAHGLNSN